MVLSRLSEYVQPGCDKPLEPEPSNIFCLMLFTVVVGMCSCSSPYDKSTPNAIGRIQAGCSLQLCTRIVHGEMRSVRLVGNFLVQVLAYCSVTLLACVLSAVSR